MQFRTHSDASNTVRHIIYHDMVSLAFPHQPGTQTQALTNLLEYLLLTFEVRIKTFYSLYISELFLMVQIGKKKPVLREALR